MTNVTQYVTKNGQTTKVTPEEKKSADKVDYKKKNKPDVTTSDEKLEETK